MILDGRLVPSGDEENLVDLIGNQLLRHILNGRLARHRKHFFGLRFRGRQQPGTDASYRDDCASNHLLNITGCALMIHLETSAADSGKRLDHFLQGRLSEYSRARLQAWIKSGRVRINRRPHKSSYLLRGAE